MYRCHWLVVALVVGCSHPLAVAGEQPTSTRASGRLQPYLDEVPPVPHPPKLAYSVYSVSDHNHLDDLAQGMRGTACDMFFVCPMYRIDKWDGHAFTPCGGGLLGSARALDAVRRLKEAGYKVAIQPIWTLDRRTSRDMIPNVNAFWPMWAHTDGRTVEAWRQVLWHWVEVGADFKADYLVFLHEATNLLPYPGWEDFIKRAKGRAPGMKFIFSHHSFQNLRLHYGDLLDLAVGTISVLHAKGDTDTAAARLIEMALKRSIMPGFQLPSDPNRVRQIGNDFYRRYWVGFQTADDRAAGRYPYLELIRNHVDAVKSSDYWPHAMMPDSVADMVKAYRSIPYEPGPDFKRTPVTVDLYAAQGSTRRLFGKDKLWFRETGVDPHCRKWLKKKYPAFLQATVEAWTGHTDYVVWWPGGYERRLVEAFRVVSERTKRKPK